MSFAEMTGEYFCIPLIISVFINIILVYSNMFFFFPVYSQKRLSLLNYSILLVLIVVLTAILKIKIDSSFMRHYFSRVVTAEHERFSLEVIVNSFFVIQSILYCIVKEWIRNKIIERKLTEEKLSLQLKFLKSQVNPHFLFNTLNNLYSVALKNNDNETASGITKLSHIMRFMLDEVNENIITLDKEIKYLTSYIDLQKLRFSGNDDIEISFDVHGDTTNIKIPPFIFIVFIENAFKYGINYKKHSFINIKFETSDDELKFNIKNSVHNKNEQHDSGLGLKNIKERLELLYSENYNLEITTDNNIFNIDLVIRLSSKQ